MKEIVFTRKRLIAYCMAILLVFQVFSGNIEKSITYAEGTTESTEEQETKEDCMVEVNAKVTKKSVVVTYHVDETVVTGVYQAYRKVIDDEGNVIVEGVVALENDEENSVSILSETYTNEESDEADVFSISDGSYQVIFYLQNDEGTVITEEKTVSFVLDATEPTVELTCEDEDGKAADKVVCKIKVTDKNFISNGVRVWVKKQNVSGVEETTEIQDVDYENGVSHELLFEEEGNYTIYAQVEDEAGNRVTTEDVTFLIDRTAPAVSIGAEEFVSGGTYSTTTNPVILTLKMSDLNLVEDSCEVLVEKNGHEVSGIDSVFEGDLEKTATLTFDDTFTDGKYKISLKAKDVLEQMNSAEFLFTIDNTSVSVEGLKVSYDKMTADKPNAVKVGEITTYYLNDSAKVTAKVREENYADAVVHVNTCRDNEEIDNQQIHMEKKEENISLSYTDEGSYITSLYGMDGVGNESEECSVRYVIDKTAPVMDIFQVVDGEQSEIEENQLFSVTEERFLRFVVKDNHHNKGAYKIRVERKTEAMTTSTTVLAGDDVVWVQGEHASELCFENESLFEKEGQYTVTMTGEDLAGNKAIAKKVTFYIDSTMPIITQCSAVQDGKVYGENVRLEYDIQEFNYENVDAKVEIVHTLNGTTQTSTKTLKMEKVRTSFEHLFTEQGKYTITVTAKDEAGNEALQPNSSEKGYRISFVIDKEKPSLAVVGVQNHHMTTQPVALTFQSKDRNHDFSKYSIRVSRQDVNGELESFVITGNKKTTYDVGAGWSSDGYIVGQQQLYQTNRTLRFQKEGIYRITFTGEDKAEHTERENAITFIIDRTAPVISDLTYSDTEGILTERYQSIFSNKAIRLEFKVEDSVAGVDDKGVCITVGDYTDKTDEDELYIAHKAVGNYYYVYIPTDLGVNEFDSKVTIWAKDKLANGNHMVSSRVVYRTAKPSIHMECEVDYSKWTNDNITFHTTVADPIAGLKEVVYKVDGKVQKKVTFKKLTYSYSYDVVASEEASKVTGYPVIVEVTNNSGVTKTVKRQVYIDKTKPMVQLTGVDNGTHYRTNQTFLTNVKDVSYENTRTVYYVTRMLDGKKTTMSMAPFTSKQYEDSCKRKLLKEGEYRIYAITTDSAGNKKKSNTLSFVVDKTSPVVSVTGVANGAMSASAVTLRFECEESFYATNDVEIEIERSIDGKTTTSKVEGFPKNSKKAVMQQTFSEDGTYKVSIHAQDKAGNASAMQTLTFSVDSTTPVIRIIGTENYQMWSKPAQVQFSIEESYYADSSITIRGTRTDEDGNVKEVTLPLIEPNGKISSLSQLFSEDGIYEFEITAKDKAGNQDSQRIHFTVDQTYPEIKGIDQYNGGYYQYFQLAESMEDVFRDLTVVSYRLLLNGVEYNGTDTIEQEGKYNLYVEAEDELGHVNMQNIEFVVDHTPPKVIFSGVKDGELVEEEGVVSLTLTNSDDMITAVRMNGVEYAADTRSLSYRDYGSYRIEVDCEDQAGNKVTRELYFVYNDPMTVVFVATGMGVLVLVLCVWMWVRTRRKEKEK